MQRDVTGSKRSFSSSVGIDELLAILSSGPRRHILFHLRQHKAATIDELTDVFLTVENHDSNEETRENVSTELLHVHLPKLEDSGLITYHVDQGVVESTDRDADIGEWLDLAVRYEIQFERSSETDTPDGDHVRILLADDEPGLPESIAAYIERETDDIEVTTATSALEAITLLENNSFDCIVSDYQMPVVSGLDFLKVVRREEPAVPFIVFTAKGSETVASQAIATGVTDYVRKGPSTDRYDELVERVRSAVAQDGY